MTAPAFTESQRRALPISGKAVTFQKLSIIIPVYNEEGTIREVLERVRAAHALDLEKEIIVVDDGSRDATRALLKQIEGIRCIFHEKNLGKGGAVKTGIAHASGDIVLIQDADLEYNPEDYPALIKPLLNGEADFVMGSRFLSKWPKFFTAGGDPFFSHFLGNLIITHLTNALYGQRFSDYEACYKVLPRALASSIPVKTSGFAYDNELICKVLRRGHIVREVPVRYVSRSYSDGKKINWRDGIVMVWTLLKWRFLPF